MRFVRWAGLLLLLTATVAMAAARILFDRQPMTFWSTMPLWYIIPGLVVMAKRPWHQAGWFLIMLGLGLATTDLPITPVDLDPRWYPWLSWANGSWGGYFAYTALAALLVAFPDTLAERSPRDRRIGRTIIVIMVALTLISATSDPVNGTAADGSTGPTFDNPLIVRLIPKAVSDIGYVPVLLLIFFCVIWLWRRQRHEHGEERRRYTLVLYSFAILAVSLMFGISFSAITEWAWLGARFSWYALPAAFAYAVVRQGLYGVDRLVSRTISYGLLGGIVAAVYAVPVVLLPRLLGESNELVVASSTLASAAVFNPARRRIQRAVDRRFNRAKYDAEREIDSVSRRLASLTGAEQIQEQLEAALTATVAPATWSVWIPPDRSDRRGEATSPA